jgi:hypothetical protein
MIIHVVFSLLITSVVIRTNLLSSLPRPTPDVEMRPDAARTLRAGAYAIDVSPTTFPVLVNGGFLQANATRVNDPLFAKCLVLGDGTTRLAIVVVDSCMMPRELLDRAKAMAREKTGIATEQMLISATHTHSAPSAMGALGCAADPAYVALLPGRIAEGVERAAVAMVPAKIGWAAIDDDRHTFCRRWIRRPDKLLDDPFGNRSVRANMHPGYVNPDAIAPSGPVDPALTVLSLQTLEGRPIAILANYSQHYYGASPVSADYYSKFAVALTRKLGVERQTPPFVGIMSQGTSGDQMWMDYSRPRDEPGIDRYAEEVADSAFKAYKSITAYHDRVPLAMAETTLSLRRRVPDAQRLAWGRAIAEKMGSRPPKDLPEVYAREALSLHDEPRRELKLQAICIGELGIAAIPNEVFALTGLKLKARSPFATTMNIELANGSEGYIPPPEQHALGGYTTWPARTAALEVQAEPKIVATVLSLLEQVAGRPRRDAVPRPCSYSEHVLASRPMAYWRLDEMEGSEALDWTGHEHLGRYEPGIAFFLPGADLPGFLSGGQLNRAVHFAGGRLVARLTLPAESYSVELWFWNGLPTDARPVTSHLLAHGTDSTSGDTLSLGGSAGGTAKGRLIFTEDSSSSPLSGRSEIVPKTWHHIVLTRTGRQVAVYLDGNARPEIIGQADVHQATTTANTVYLGGRHDHEATFEGKIDEVACYDRPLTPAEIAEHFHAAVNPRGETASP